MSPEINLAALLPDQREAYDKWRHRLEKNGRLRIKKFHSQTISRGPEGNKFEDLDIYDMDGEPLVVHAIVRVVDGNKTRDPDKLITTQYVVDQLVHENIVNPEQIE